MKRIPPNLSHAQEIIQHAKSIQGGNKLIEIDNYANLPNDQHELFVAVQELYKRSKDTLWKLGMFMKKILELHQKKEINKEDGRPYQSFNELCLINFEFSDDWAYNLIRVYEKFSDNPLAHEIPITTLIPIARVEDPKLRKEILEDTVRNQWGRKRVESHIKELKEEKRLEHIENLKTGQGLITGFIAPVQKVTPNPPPKKKFPQVTVINVPAEKVEEEYPLKQTLDSIIKRLENTFPPEYKNKSSEELISLINSNAFELKKIYDLNMHPKELETKILVICAALAALSIENYCFHARIPPQTL